MPSKPAFTEFVAMIALLIGLTAFSIDNLLPAFDPITQSLKLADPNQIQLIILSFMVSFAIMQLFYGPLSDHFGRKSMLMCGLGIYLLGSLVGFLSTDFQTLVIGRVLQGIGAASPRVLTTAIVRDRYAGREMARVLSLTMMVFIIVPIVAPSVGSFVIALGSWRLIFLTMFLFAAVLILWLVLRLPETLARERDSPSILSSTLIALPRILTTREVIDNTTALSLMLGCMMTYLVSSPRIFQSGIYDLGHGFPLVFAIIALFMGMAFFANSALVRRFGMHRLSHVGLWGFTLAAALLLGEGLVYGGRPPVVLLVATLAVAHFQFSLTTPNLNSMAMEPVGDIAGTAASFIGFYSTLVSAAIGYVFGKAFNGTIIPLAICYLTMGGFCLLILFFAHRGRFNPKEPPASSKS